MKSKKKAEDTMLFPLPVLASAGTFAKKKKKCCKKYKKGKRCKSCPGRD